MQDRPTVDELLEAVAGFLTEDVMPATTGRVNFHARVAGNVLQMLRRELERDEEHLEREWRGLDALLGDSPRPATLTATRRALDERNRDLDESTRRGDADRGAWRKDVLAHLRQIVADKLAVSNPTLAAGWTQRG